MRRLLGRYFCLSVVLLLGNQLHGQTFKTLHHFTGSDGSNPRRRVVLSGNILYGATYGGGLFGVGTVFRINADGTQFTNIYHFSGPAAASPSGELLLVGSTLYGTTEAGGTSGHGTVFAVNTDGSDFRTLSSFTESIVQASGLVLSGYHLYGTTDGGGTSGTGVVFKVNTNGTGFMILRNFDGGIPFNSGGSYPLAGLTLSGDTLYGTTGGGGSSAGGIIFRIQTDGTGFTNLHNFTSDAYDPNAGLVLSGDTLYGAAIMSAGSGAGSMFKISTNGIGYTNFYYFSGGWDGGGAANTPSLSGNTLYGSTGWGGSWDNGVIFNIHTDGTGFGALHEFSALSSGTNIDGAKPWAGVVSSGNMLYGGTSNGGSTGNGTLFSIFVLPELKIRSAGSDAVLEWPTNATGFSLQSSTNLLSGIWTNVVAGPVVLNGNYAVTNPISEFQKFYRLGQ